MIDPTLCQIDKSLAPSRIYYYFGRDSVQFSQIISLMHWYGVENSKGVIATAIAELYAKERDVRLFAEKPSKV